MSLKESKSHSQQTTSTVLHSSTSSGDQALEVFCSVAQKDLSQDIPYPLPTIDVDQLSEMLQQLDIDASPEETVALFRYLDVDDDGQVTFDEFLPWYSSAAQAAQDSSAAFQDLLISRRTVDNFDDSPVDNAVLRRAVQCAIAAPNRSGSEPWRFIKLGKGTVDKLVELVELKSDLNMEEDRNADNVMSLWREIPGWVVVTTRVTPDDPSVELEDYQSTSCAVQNLMVRPDCEKQTYAWYRRLVFLIFCPLFLSFRHFPAKHVVGRSREQMDKWTGTTHTRICGYMWCRS